MYVPVLHARQEEKLALRPINEAIIAAGNVKPLAIPVRDDPPYSGSAARQTSRLITEFTGSKLSYYILTTPIAPKVEITQSDILHMLSKLDNDRMATPVIAVTSTKPIKQLKTEISKLDGANFAVLHAQDPQAPRNILHVLEGYKKNINAHIFYDEHCSKGYTDLWKPYFRVLVRDGFRKKPRNSDYSSEEQEFFSRIPYTYTERGFDGHGDHTIVGEKYSPGGGRARKAAAHLTYPPKVSGSQKEIWVRHFVSDDDTRIATEAECREQAVGKLLSFYNDNLQHLGFSTACQEFGASEDAPGLAKMKRLCIRHHIEMMMHLNL